MDVTPAGTCTTSEISSALSRLSSYLAACACWLRSPSTAGGAGGGVGGAGAGVGVGCAASFGGGGFGFGFGGAPEDSASSSSLSGSSGIAPAVSPLGSGPRPAFSAAACNWPEATAAPSSFPSIICAIASISDSSRGDASPRRSSARRSASWSPECNAAAVAGSRLRGGGAGEGPATGLFADITFPGRGSSGSTGTLGVVVGGGGATGAVGAAGGADGMGSDGGAGAGEDGSSGSSGLALPRRPFILMTVRDLAPTPAFSPPALGAGGRSGTRARRKSIMTPMDFNENLCAVSSNERKITCWQPAARSAAPAASTADRSTVSSSSPARSMMGVSRLGAA